MPDLAGRLGALEGGEGAQLLYLGPALAAQGVEEVEVDVVGPEPLELLVEVAVPVVLRLDHPHRALGGEEKLSRLPERSRAAPRAVSLACLW